MIRKLTPKRTRIFFAVEGEGEQSFIKFLKILSDQQELYVHLDCEILGGGGYRKMLEKAIALRNHKERSKAKASILLIDSDRTINDDRWSHDKLCHEARKNKIDVCFQNPNQEGLFLRMLPGKENLQPKAPTAHKDLCKAWQDYQKPIDANILLSKYTLQDLLRVATLDPQVKFLLETIGFKLKHHNKK